MNHSSFFSKSLLTSFLCDSHSFFFHCDESSDTISSSKWVCKYPNISQSSFEIRCLYLSVRDRRSFISDLNYSTARPFRILVSSGASLGMNFGCSFRGIFGGSCCKRSLYIEKRREIL